MAYTGATRLNLDGVQLSSITMKIFDDARLSKMIGIMPNMLNGMPLARIKGSDKITAQSAGCADVTGNPEVAKEAIKTVNFGIFEVNPTFCPKELTGKILAKGMKPDSDPEELAAIISQLAENGAKLDLLRMAWLGDTAINNTEILNTGLAIEDYNAKDGFYKQILAIAAVNPKQKVTLDVTKLLANVQEAKQKIYFGARATAKLLVTSGLYSKIESLTMTAANETAQMRMIEGVPTLYFNGFEVIELAEVSNYINSDYQTPWEFAVLTPIDNLAVPMDRSEITASEWIKDAKSKKWYLEADYQADFKVVDDASVVLIAK